MANTWSESDKLDSAIARDKKGGQVNKMVTKIPIALLKRSANVAR